MRLQGKVALVTGGARGIGRGIVEGLAREGASVAVNYEARRDAAEDAVRAAMDLGAKAAIAVQANVSNREQVEAMVLRVVGELGGINTLVNNAGRCCPGALIDYPEDEIDRTLAVNVKGVFLCSIAAARQMIAQGRGGRIINVSSRAGRTGEALGAPYSASKAAVLSFTQAAALEWAQHKIGVVAVLPGAVETDMFWEVLGKWAGLQGVSTQSVYEGLVQQIPLGHTQSPDNFGRVVAFLASDDAYYITGEAINVSGGLEIH